MAIKQIFCYLQEMKNFSLVYGGEPYQWTNKLDSYTDTDFGMHLDQKSVSGYAFLLGGAAISWSSKKQGLVTLSSTESEYVATMHATKQLMWLRKLLENLGFPQPEALTLYLDNQSVIVIIFAISLNQTKCLAIQNAC